MKKIMFDDRNGLTAAVLDGTKTMTRRIIPKKYVELADGMEGACILEAQSAGQCYKNGEVVAVAQRGIDIYHALQKRYGQTSDAALGFKEMYKGMPMWNNKMFVPVDLCPSRIRITNIGVERMQDISDEDCAKEGIVNFEWTQHPEPFSNETIEHSSFSTAKCRDAILDPWTPRNFVPWFSESAKDAFASLVGRTIGKKAWLDNPWVYVYSFELVK